MKSGRDEQDKAAKGNGNAATEMKNEKRKRRWGEEEGGGETWVVEKEAEARAALLALPPINITNRGTSTHHSTHSVCLRAAYKLILIQCTDADAMPPQPPLDTHTTATIAISTVL